MLAVIGGTGFGSLAGLESVTTESHVSPFGETTVQRGVLEGAPLLFLPRHGLPPSVPPHKINYRANLSGLRALGATRIIAVTAVGGVDPTLAVPEIVLPDQVIDYTWGREHTFFDDEIHHIDLTWPYDQKVRAALLVCLESLSPHMTVSYRPTGVYGCTQGPRLETAAEIRRMGRDGCHIVGMTGMPEAALARELEIPYAGISVVVNAGAGIGGKQVALDEIESAMSKGMYWVAEVLKQYCRSA